jgi:multidrug resistance efflux pump
MARDRDLLMAELAHANRQVDAARQVVQDQQAAIARLKAEYKDIGDAVSLLDHFVTSLEMLEADRDAIKQELDGMR